VHQIADLLVAETSDPGLGTTTALDRLIDLLLIAFVRTWLTDLEEPNADWLTALTDPIIGPCLERLHADIGSEWTLQRLADDASVSRSTIARKFTSAVGEPPLNYLTRIRLDRAADLLRSSDATLATIAREVGYDSEFALSKAFKRVKGLSPTAHRSFTAPDRRPARLPRTS